MRKKAASVLIRWAYSHRGESMEKETKKSKNTFIIRDHYERGGVKVKELMEKEIYGKIINELG